MSYCCGISEIGNIRKFNEDAFLINNIVLSHSQIESKVIPPFIVAVADGVGGENNGAKASHLSLELLSNIKYTSKTNLNKKILDIHQNIRSYGMNHPDSLNMQTTLCALAVDENGEASFVNIGDSRMYRMHNGKLTQITKDQSLVQLLVDLGEISSDEIEKHKQKHVILSSLGNVEQVPEPQIEHIGKLNSDEIILICSDGLSDAVSSEEICSVLSKNHSLRKKLSELISLAIKNGSRDNITVLAVAGASE